MPTKKDYVVLLHGFLRTALSMKRIADSLVDSGYIVINLDYPSREKTIENLADNFLQKVITEQCPDKTKKIHFVTHSMGGIIVRYFLAKNELKNLGRVVMLAPPNNGSKVADFLAKYPYLESLLGPALPQLQTEDRGLAWQLPPPNYEVGIIAAKFDKKVSTESAKLENMKDFLITPNTHTTITISNKAIQSTINFLNHGKF